MSHLLLVRVGLHDQAQIGLRLELLQGEVCQRHAIPAVDVLVLVLHRSVYDEESVEVHQNAAACGPFALAVVLRRREDGEYLRCVPNKTATCIKRIGREYEKSLQGTVYSIPTVRYITLSCPLLFEATRLLPQCISPK